MKLVGVGVDLAEVGKFARRPYGKNRVFYEKIFSQGEISYCLSKSQPAQRFAGYFAAKEAVVKALGWTIFDMRSIAISHDESGAPRAMLLGKRKAKVLVSLTHQGRYAAAVVVAYV